MLTSTVQNYICNYSLPFPLIFFVSVTLCPLASFCLPIWCCNFLLGSEISLPFHMFYNTVSKSSLLISFLRLLTSWLWIFFSFLGNPRHLLWYLVCLFCFLVSGSPFSHSFLSIIWHHCCSSYQWNPGLQSTFLVAMPGLWNDEIWINPVLLVFWRAPKTHCFPKPLVKMESFLLSELLQAKN